MQPPPLAARQSPYPDLGSGQRPRSWGENGPLDEQLAIAACLSRGCREAKPASSPARCQPRPRWACLGLSTQKRPPARMFRINTHRPASPPDDHRPNAVRHHAVVCPRDPQVPRPLQQHPTLPWRFPRLGGPRPYPSRPSLALTSPSPSSTSIVLERGWDVHISFRASGG